MSESASVTSTDEVQRSQKNYSTNPKLWTSKSKTLSKTKRVSFPDKVMLASVYPPIWGLLARKIFIIFTQTIFFLLNLYTLRDRSVLSGRFTER